MSGRSPFPDAITLTSQGLHETEAGSRSRSQEPNPSAVMWDAGILTSRFNTCSPDHFSRGPLPR